MCLLSSLPEGLAEQGLRPQARVQTSTDLILHALFDLKAGVAEADFMKALEDFCAHLQQSGYLLGWRWMRQIVPPGPSFPRPLQPQFVALEFRDEESEQRCYEYVARTRSRSARCIAQ